MYQRKYVFAQLVSFLDRSKFNRIVSKYLGNSYVKSFTCWNQMLVMMFGQLPGRESLRDLVVAVEAHRGKAYHLGFGKGVTRSNLAKANGKRNYRIFEEYAFFMVELARKLRVAKVFDLGGNVYAFDSTTIELCLSVFCWAKFRRHKGGIKVHTLYDIETKIPAFILITAASANDTKAMPSIPVETGAYYIFDRAYNFFGELFRIAQADAFYVVRAKRNLRYKAVRWKRRLPPGVLSDSEIELTGDKTAKQYPKALRRVVYHDKEQDRTFTFLTNAMDISALEVALLYKNRWHVEMFFKWLKQHLKVKRFWGETENAVHIQVYCAIIAYCLVAIVQNKLQLDRSIYETLQVLGISLTDTTPLRDLFDKHNFEKDDENDNKIDPTLFDEVGI